MLKKTNSLLVWNSSENVLQGNPKFSVTAQRKLKSAPALCIVDFLEMFQMLLAASQGLKIHTTNLSKYQVFLTGFRWAKIFRQSAIKTPIEGNPTKPVSNDQLLWRS